MGSVVRPAAIVASNGVVSLLALGAGSTTVADEDEELDEGIFMKDEESLTKERFDAERRGKRIAHRSMIGSRSGKAAPAQTNNESLNKCPRLECNKGEVSVESKCQGREDIYNLSEYVSDRV
jgi:hypothetical protein